MIEIKFPGPLKLSRHIGEVAMPKVQASQDPMNTKLTTPPSILVVEDYESLRSSVVQWLQVRFPGCAVEGVESGERALEHASAAHPDVVLMDINLPGIDGLKATRRLK